MSYQPKSYNKFLAGAATAAVVASAVVPVATHAAEKNLTDVKEGSYYAEAVNALAEAGVIKGYEDGTFRPNNQVTRAEVAKIIAVQLGLDTENAGSANYSDAKGHWANTGGYLAAVAKAGIMKGDGNGTFRPNAPLTRAEMASIVVRAYDLQAKEGFESQFKDLNAGGAWAADAIKTLEANGYANGIAKGQFGSASNVKRADVAVFLFRVAKGEAAPTVESVSAINNIEVNEGAETVNLPKEVEVKLSNGEKAQKAVEWDKKGLDLNKPGEYTLTGDVADTDLTASVKVVVKAVDPKVESVSAINAQQVLVTFNKEVEKTTAENIANYNVTLASTGASQLDTDGSNNDDSTVTLQSDKKSVIIDLDPSNTNRNKFVKAANYEVKVNKDSVKDTSGKFVSETKKTFVFADTTAASVKEVKATASGFTVKFTEPIDLTNTGVVKVNGVNLPASAISAGSDKYSVNIAYTTEAGKSYDVYTSAFEDLLGNKSSAETKTVQYVKDTVAPVLQSVGQDGDLTLTLKFSEEIAAGSTVKVYRDGTTFVASATPVQDADDDTLYTVTLPASTGSVDLYPSGQTSTTVKVELSNFKDAAGNVTPGLTKDVTLTRTVKTPQVLDTKWDGVNAVIKLDTVLDSTTEVASKLLVTDSTGAEVTTASASVASDAAGTDADGKYIIVSGLSADKEYTLNFTRGFAKDKSVVPNETGNYTINLNTKSSSLDKTAPSFDSITAAGNVISVVFDETLDSSARNLANFKLDGVALPSGSVAVLSQTNVANDTVKITLPDGSINADASYLLSYSNIKDLAGNVAEAGSRTVALDDTVKPVLKSAEVQKSTNEILLTFSENVGIGLSTDVDADFVVKVNGVALDASQYVVAEDSNTDDKVLKVTLTGVNAVDQTVSVATITNPSLVKDTSNNANVLIGGTTVTASQK
ncbi:S-layer homology domain-containing protein [Heyndrickxia oleronia]|uniref:SLH domain-containing protein n=1 Tax=Heyndrickxia oleronia TaxID=38875 RepID=A0A8E2IDC5_9BACI|nr:S-layer homology domain-containing protein [Heyndrickxia oleronia]MEC1377062.1 S-layer homology domain-containing protein [Heyndrickxia oleronia]OOP70410.1 hypothetical protein BWZ43_00005 [Heyndrickxia oleronia]QQZ05762.1 S-layer homology domain-containing protein [Heyndrickxia oleronia]